MRFSHKVQHVPGKQQILADALSRAPAESDDLVLVEEVETFATVTFMPAYQTQLAEVTEAQKSDEEISTVHGFSHDGWPACMPNCPTLKL